jgi:hypothetical protein
MDMTVNQAWHGQTAPAIDATASENRGWFSKTQAIDAAVFD